MATARTITKNGNGTLTLGTAATSLVDGTSIDLNAGTLNYSDGINHGTNDSNITNTVGGVANFSRVVFVSQAPAIVNQGVANVRNSVFIYGIAAVTSTSGISNSGALTVVNSTFGSQSGIQIFNAGGTVTLYNTILAADTEVVQQLLSGAHRLEAPLRRRREGHAGYAEGLESREFLRSDKA